MYVFLFVLDTSFPFKSNMVVIVVMFIILNFFPIRIAQFLHVPFNPEKIRREAALVPLIGSYNPSQTLLV